MLNCIIDFCRLKLQNFKIGMQHNDSHLDFLNNDIRNIHSEFSFSFKIFFKNFCSHFKIRILKILNLKDTNL